MKKGGDSPRPTLPVVISRENLEGMMVDSGKNKLHTVPFGKKRIQVDHDERSLVSTLATKRLNTIKEDIKERNFHDWIATFIPAYKWLRVYNFKEFLYGDVVAGLTVGIMLVPQSMSYAKLAGLPVQFGLYSGLVPVFAYALFGSSRQLAVGPVALLSLMLNTEVTKIVAPDGGDFTDEMQTQYNNLAIQASMLVGVFYIAMGILRLGFVTNILSHAVISGFTTGAAVIIGMSQVKYILGYKVKRSDRLHQVLKNIFADIEKFNHKTFLMGMSGIFTLLLLKHIGKKYKRFSWVRALGPLFVCTVSIIVTYAGKLDEDGIPIIAEIPSGLPSATFSPWSPIDSKLMKTVITMVVVGFMESIAIAKQLAAKHKYDLDSNLELLGLGIANFTGAMFSSYPVTGSFSRSAVNNESGAKSGISAVVTATLVMLVLLFMTSIFEYIPLATLAAIVISGVIGLLDYDEAIYLWKVHKFDFLVWIVSCFGTMFLGVEIGLIIAVVLSLLIILFESAYPHTAVLGRLPGSTVYRNVKQYDDAEQYEGLVVCRIDAPLYFANTQYVRDKLDKYHKNGQEQSSRDVKYLIVDLSPVSHIDTSALHTLEDLSSDYKNRGITLCLSNPSRIVMQRLEQCGLVDKIGFENIFVSTHAAVCTALKKLSPTDDDIEVPKLSPDSSSTDNCFDNENANEEQLGLNVNSGSDTDSNGNVNPSNTFSNP